MSRWIMHEVPVQCMSSGCTWRGIYSDASFNRHVCGKLGVECRNDGCQHKCTREQRAQHANTCIKKEILCSVCHKSVTQDLIDHHHSSLCFHVRVLCPLWSSFWNDTILQSKGRSNMLHRSLIAYFVVSEATSFYVWAAERTRPPNAMCQAA